MFAADIGLNLRMCRNEKMADIKEGLNRRLNKNLNENNCMAAADTPFKLSGTACYCERNGCNGRLRRKQ